MELGRSIMKSWNLSSDQIANYNPVFNQVVRQQNNVTQILRTPVLYFAVEDEAANACSGGNILWQDFTKPTPEPIPTQANPGNPSLTGAYVCAGASK